MVFAEWGFVVVKNANAGENAVTATIVSANLSGVCLAVAVWLVGFGAGVLRLRRFGRIGAENQGTGGIENSAVGCMTTNRLQNVHNTVHVHQIHERPFARRRGVG
jgi:hypothetical protein